jgi:hypothetical protein
MKIQYSVTHVPTGKTVTTKPEDVSPNEINVLKELLQACASGKANYLTLETNMGAVTIGKNLLPDCTFTISECDSE